MKGVCLRLMGHDALSEHCLKQVIELNDFIKEDTYLVPYATIELALLSEDQGDTDSAISYLDDAK